MTLLAGEYGGEGREGYGRDLALLEGEEEAEPEDTLPWEVEVMSLSTELDRRVLLWNPIYFSSMYAFIFFESPFSHSSIPRLTTSFARRER